MCTINVRKYNSLTFSKLIYGTKLHFSSISVEAWEYYRLLSWTFPGGHRVCPCNGFSVDHFGLISCVWPCSFTHLQLQTAVAVEAGCLTHHQAQLGSGLSSAHLVPRPRHTRSISVWTLRDCLRLWRSERAARPHQGAHPTSAWLLPSDGFTNLLGQKTYCQISWSSVEELSWS